MIGHRKVVCHLKHAHAESHAHLAEGILGRAEPTTDGGLVRRSCRALVCLKDVTWQEGRLGGRNVPVFGAHGVQKVVELSERGGLCLQQRPSQDQGRVTVDGFPSGSGTRCHHDGDRTTVPQAQSVDAAQPLTQGRPRRAGRHKMVGIQVGPHLARLGRHQH